MTAASNQVVGEDRSIFCRRNGLPYSSPISVLFFFGLFEIFSLFFPASARAADPVADDPVRLSGPVSLPIQEPLWMLHGSLPPTAAAAEAAGKLSSGLLMSWTNTFDRKAGSYRFDEETVVADTSLAYGLADGIETGIHLPLITRGGGILDSFIENWHDVFQLPNGGRSDYPQDQYHITGDYSDGTRAALGSSGSGIGNPDLWLKFEIENLKWIGFDSVKLAASLPGATDTYGHDGTDAGLQLLGSGQLWTCGWNWGGGYMFLSDTQIEEVSYRNNLLSGFLSANYPISGSFDLFSTALISSTPLKGITNYPDYALYLDLGTRWHFSSDTALDLMIREDPIGSASADISFVLGLTAGM